MVNKLPMKWTLTVILLLGLSPYLNAQLSANLPLQSNDPQIQAVISPEVPIRTMTSIDLNPFIEEDLINDQTDGAWRFAVPISVNLNLQNSGKWDQLPNGDRIWRLHIKSAGAVSTNLLYREFYLPKYATLHIYNPQKEEVRGAFTSANNKKDRVFATALIKGESVILEYYEPAIVKGQGVIDIMTVNHGYRGYGENNNHTGNSGSCQNDVNCSGNSTWQTVKRAVGKWTVGGSAWCTGTLMNNTNQDCRPLFLTANHCIDGSTSLGLDAISNNGPINTLIFYWNFETPGCNLGEQGDASQTTVGVATVLANPYLNGSITSSSDFALFELAENPKSSYNVYFAGWDASGNTGTGGAGIHHPAGDVKKISIHSQTPASSFSNFWRILPWDVFNGNRGVTEGGSSGSGLFRSNGRLIGQLFGALDGGNPNCSDPVNDRADYGQLAYSWTNGGASDSRRRLNVHFDPVGSGATTVLGGSANPCGMPSNVVCENALDIGCGGSRTVNTMNATSDGNPGPGFCGVNLVSGQKGVWYKFNGNGKQVTVSTCDAFTDFDTKLAVFSGSCGSLTCVGGNDDSPGCSIVTRSEFKFVSSPGTTYYIFLSGFGGQTGNARVSITCCDLPEAKCRNRTLALDPGGSASVGNNYVNDNSTFDCGLGSRILSKKNFNCGDVGPNPVTYTVTDACGNTSSCSATITVQDNTPPTALCKNITVALDNTGNVSITGAQLNNGSNDACGIQSYSADPNSFDCSTVGAQTATLTVTDVNNNTSSCLSNVFVDPTAAMPPDLSEQNCGSCGELRMFFCQFDPSPSPLDDFIDGTVQMNATYVPGNPLYWYNDNAGTQGAAYAGNGSQPPVPDLSVGNTNFYFWVAQVNQLTGCVGNAIRVRIRVRKTPIVSFDTPPLPFCYGGQVDLAEWVDDANNVADKYDFYDGDPNGGGTFLGSVTATNGNVDPLNYVVVSPQVGNNTYWVVATNTGNSNTISCSATAMATIPVAATSTLAPISDVTVNSGDWVNKSFFSPNATHIFWIDHYSFGNPDIGLMGTIGMGNLSFQAHNPSASPRTAMIRVLTYIDNCAGQYRDFNITVNPAPGARQGRSNSLALAAYKLNVHDVRLAWDIIYDQQLLSFEIEKLKAGIDQSDDISVITGMNNWEKIATVDYASSQASYTFIDTDGMSNVTKYRLKLIHKDGSAVWSEVVEVNFDFFDGDRFMIFPNPSDGVFQLRSAMPISEAWSYQISDALGRTISQGPLKGEEQSFDIREQAVGVYFLIIRGPQGQRYLKRVVRK